MTLTERTLSRRTALRAAAVAAAAAGTGFLPRGTGYAATTVDTPRPVRALHARIRDGMERYAIPGVAVAVRYGGREYVDGFGVTNVDDPRPVDGDTVFRIGSTTKTVTGTAMMRLVERGAVDLDRRVRAYVPDLRTADPSVAHRVTVRQLLDHSAGWLGDLELDTGQGADALARYVAALDGLPQLTRPGAVFAYNNAAISLAGRVIEMVTGRPYEQAIRDLVLDPLRLSRSAFFVDEYAGANVAVSHNVVNGKPVVEPGFYPMPRGLHPAGGLISSARDQLAYARFHLGDGRAPDGTRLLRRRSLAAMRTRPGPGGTMFVETDGWGVALRLRPSAEGVRIIEHGGAWAGQYSGFLLVPERDFAFTMLTNSEGGPSLVAELFTDDWALRAFAGLRNLPAVPRDLPAAALARYEGAYVLERIGRDGATQQQRVELVREGGRIGLREHDQPVGALAFYGRDRAIILDPAGRPDHSRADFLRDRRGAIEWLRIGGRLLRREA